MTTNDQVLNSWKEVATYMGRGVRTVQRWEQELGLPVRRPRGKSRSAVIAFKSELDQWLHRAPSELLQQENPEEAAPACASISASAREAAKHSRFERQARLHDNTAFLHDNTALLIAKARLLLSRSSNLCDQLKSLKIKVNATALNVRRNSKHLADASAPKPLAATLEPQSSQTAPLEPHSTQKRAIAG